MSFKIGTISHFDRELKRLSKKYPSIKSDLSVFIESILKEPFQGEGLGKNCYKVRMKISSKGKGKSAGSRIITCVKVVDQHIILLSIYDKSDTSNISDNFLLHLLSVNGLL